MKDLLTILFLAECLWVPCVVAKTQELFVAALEMNWDYLHTDLTDPAANQRRFASGVQRYTKAVYVEFIDSTFRVQKTKPPWAGIQGPTLRAEVNDRLVVHFKNFASQPFSISPIGVPYWKQSEGAGYEDSTSVQERADDAVPPGGYYKYVWDIPPSSGPTTADPDCLTYSYSSQVDIVRDFNSGLIGAFLICKPGALTEQAERKVPEFVLLFAVFDESKSWYRVENRSDKPRKSSSRSQFHTINGYVNSTLPGLKICQKSPEVSWHLIGQGSTPDIHTIQFQDHTLKVMNHRRVTLDITPMTFTTATMKPYAVGKFLISCRIHSHQQAGMSAVFTVDNCPEPAQLPDKRHVKWAEEEDEGRETNEDYQMDGLFSTIVLRPGGPASVLRSSGRGRPKVWVHYISAEEISWDYNPGSNGPLGSGNLGKHLRKVYKKVAYVEYTDKTFTVRKSKNSMLIGPEIRGEVEDQIQIVFKNMASQPFNIYPNGLTSVQPVKKRNKEKQVDLRSLAVPPGEIMMYLWKLTAEDAPTEADPRCLTRLYHSTVDPERDMASGLVGPLIICKSQSLDLRGKVVTSDRERHLIFSVFDENKSWYSEENVQKHSENYNDLTYYNSNVMYSVNGFMHNSLQFKICLGDVTLWHVASAGMQNDFLSVYFKGNLFERDRAYDTVLTLFPMTGDTVTIEMETEGEWEISAFDPAMKKQGMSARYSVFNCERVLPLVDSEEYEDDFEDYIEQNFPVPRGVRQRNRTMAIRVCKKPARNRTQTDLLSGHRNMTQNSLENERRKSTLVCEIKYVPVEEAEYLDVLSQGGIPQDILDQLDKEKSKSSSERQKRFSSIENIPETQTGQPLPISHRSDIEWSNKTETTAAVMVEEDQNLIAIMTQTEETARYPDEEETEGSSLGSNLSTDLFKKYIQSSGWNMTSDISKHPHDSNDSKAAPKSKPNLTERSRRETWSVRKDVAELVDSNDVLKHNDDLKDSAKMDNLVEGLYPRKYAKKDPQWQEPPVESHHLLTNSSDNQTYPEKSWSMEYDDYENEGNKSTPSFNFGSNGISIRSTESKFRSYYIAAEEIMWDYGIKKSQQLISLREMRRGMRKYFQSYRKVVFRAYHDKEFQNPVKRGELDEHLGIMGPVLKAEVNDVLTVVFRNLASRPYSLHLHGVYDKTMGSPGQGVGLGEELQHGAVSGDPVPPGQERVYNWRISKRQGPSSKDFDCKAGAYYSTVNMEKDINSGLIGPLLICRPGTLVPRLLLQPGVQDVFLLFTIFDEQKSWYLDYNIRKFCTPPCQANTDDPWFDNSNRFAAINGYVAETLPGLVVAQHRTSRWHLLNVGGRGEFHAVHFHGIPFSVGKHQDHRMGIFNLYPGVFGTVEMRPATVGTWLVECTVGEHQLSGMRAKLLVYNPRCVQPLGMQSGWITDDQITESDHYGNWEARLARLHLSGSINAWIGNGQSSWIQVDLLQPMLVHGIHTQGAKTWGLNEAFTVIFTISYSLDQETWRTYRGNSSGSAYKFNGNMDGYRIKENLFSPPIIGRYIRIYPLTYGGRPTLRFELLGCDLNSCFLPLGMQRQLIPNSRISASSFLQKWFLSWSPGLSRLNQEGRANAWRPKSNNPHEWLQVDFEVVKRITGILMQGARSVLTHMMVTEFTISISHDGNIWSAVTEQGTQLEKVFEGNSDYNEEKLNLFEPPLFTRFIRIHPKGWVNDIALRVEFLGCDTQQRL
ncbi:coagulation factor VIII [Electrophorus electricus]|uniref:coagulation factor VIII n=1 Tax=Electrophorus electricus TaxID=8005 RepID=UPI0015CF8FC5|nr:coagulation factor VIII [Electrophorus electricus]